METTSPVILGSNAKPDLDLYYEIVNGKRVSLVPKPIEAIQSAALVAVALQTELVVKAPGLILYKPLIRFEEGQSRRPDLAYFTSDVLSRDTYRLQRLMKQMAKRDHVETSFVPRIAIEMISPNITIGFMQERTERYLKAGVQAVVQVLYQTRRVFVYESSTSLSIFDEDDVIETSAFGAFSRTVGEWLVVPDPDKVIPLTK
jgi:hypothetical protein